jgi:hypothetical protein
MFALCGLNVHGVELLVNNLTMTNVCLMSVEGVYRFGAGQMRVDNFPAGPIVFDGVEVVGTNSQGRVIMNFFEQGTNVVVNVQEEKSSVQLFWWGFGIAFGFGMFGLSKKIVASIGHTSPDI